MKIKIYNSFRAASTARRNYARANKSVTDVFKHQRKDKRYKQQIAYAILVKA